MKLNKNLQALKKLMHRHGIGCKYESNELRTTGIGMPPLAIRYAEGRFTVHKMPIEKYTVKITAKNSEIFFAKLLSYRLVAESHIQTIRNEHIDFPENNED